MGFNIPYIIIDEGWSAKDDIMAIKEAVDLKVLLLMVLKEMLVSLFGQQMYWTINLREAPCFLLSDGSKRFQGADFF